MADRLQYVQELAADLYRAHWFDSTENAESLADWLLDRYDMYLQQGGKPRDRSEYGVYAALDYVHECDCEEF